MDAHCARPFKMRMVPFKSCALGSRRQGNRNLMYRSILRCDGQALSILPATWLEALTLTGLASSSLAAVKRRRASRPNVSTNRGDVVRREGTAPLSFTYYV